MLKTCRYVDSKIRGVLVKNIKLLNEVASITAEKLPTKAQDMLYHLHDTIFNSRSFESIKAIQKKYQVLFDIENQVEDYLTKHSESLKQMLDTEGITIDVLKTTYYSSVYDFIKKLYTNYPDVSRQPLYEMSEYAALQRAHMLLAAKSPEFLEGSMTAFYGKFNRLGEVNESFITSMLAKEPDEAIAQLADIPAEHFMPLTFLSEISTNHGKMWDGIQNKTLIKNVGNFFNEHSFLEGNVNVIDVVKELTSTIEKKGNNANETGILKLIEGFKIAELNNGQATNAFHKKQYPTHSLDSLQDEVRLVPTKKKYIAVDIHNVNHESFQMGKPLKNENNIEFISISDIGNSFLKKIVDEGAVLILPKKSTAVPNPIQTLIGTFTRLERGTVNDILLTNHSEDFINKLNVLVSDYNFFLTPSKDALYTPAAMVQTTKKFFDNFSEATKGKWKFVQPHTATNVTATGWNIGRYETTQDAMKGVAEMFDKETDGYIKKLQGENKSTEEAFTTTVQTYLNLVAKIQKGSPYGNIRSTVSPKTYGEAFSFLGHAGMYVSNAIQNANITQPIKNENFITKELSDEAYKYSMRKFLGTNRIEEALANLKKEDISEDAMAFTSPSKESYFIASLLKPLRETTDVENIYENALRYEFRTNIYNLGGSIVHDFLKYVYESGGMELVKKTEGKAHTFKSVAELVSTFTKPELNKISRMLLLRTQDTAERNTQVLRSALGGLSFQKPIQNGFTINEIDRVDDISESFARQAEGGDGYDKGFDSEGKRTDEMQATTELENLDDIITSYIRENSNGKSLEEALEDKYVNAQFVPLNDALPGLGRIINTFPINQKLILGDYTDGVNGLSLKENSTRTKYGVPKEFNFKLGDAVFNMAQRVMVNPHEPMMHIRQIVDSIRLGQEIPEATKKFMEQFRYYVMTPSNEIITTFRGLDELQSPAVRTKLGNLALEEMKKIDSEGVDQVAYKILYETAPGEEPAKNITQLQLFNQKRNGSMYNKEFTIYRTSMHQNGLFPIAFKEFIEPITQKVPNKSLAVYDAAILKRRNELIAINVPLKNVQDNLLKAESELSRWAKALENSKPNEKAFHQSLVDARKEAIANFNANLSEANRQIKRLNGQINILEKQKQLLSPEQDRVYTRKGTLTDFVGFMERLQEKRLATSLLQNEIVFKKLHFPGKFPKDTLKYQLSDGFIGFGVEGSSTKKYADYIGSNKKIQDSELIFVSVNGSGRITEENLKLTKEAIDEAERNNKLFGFILDNTANALRPYNEVGEGVIRNYLLEKKYFYTEMHNAPDVGFYIKGDIDQIQAYLQTKIKKLQDLKMYSSDSLNKIRNSKFELTDIVNDRYGFNSKIQKQIGFKPEHKYTQYSMIINNQKYNVYSYHNLNAKEFKETVKDAYNLDIILKYTDIKVHTNVSSKNVWENLFNSSHPLYINKEYKVSSGEKIQKFAKQQLEEIQNKIDSTAEYDEYRFIIGNELTGEQLENAKIAFEETGGDTNILALEYGIKHQSGKFYDIKEIGKSKKIDGTQEMNTFTVRDFTGEYKSNLITEEADDVDSFSYRDFTGEYGTNLITEEADDVDSFSYLFPDKEIPETSLERIAEEKIMDTLIKNEAEEMCDLESGFL